MPRKAAVDAGHVHGRPLHDARRLRHGYPGLLGQGRSRLREQRAPTYGKEDQTLVFADAAGGAGAQELDADRGGRARRRPAPQGRVARPAALPWHHHRRVRQEPDPRRPAGHRPGAGRLPSVRRARAAPRLRAHAPL